MTTILSSQILLTIAILTAGVIYGTDMFHAIAGKRATELSKDSSIADLLGHTHLIADKRMPAIGITSVVSTALCTALNYNYLTIACLSGGALVMLLIHLALYLTIAKPINALMSEAAVKNRVPENIRALQRRWESVIYYRAGLLLLAMLMLILAVDSLH